MLGGTEIVIIAGVLGVLIFGPSFLRKIGSASGETIREFKKVRDEFNEPTENKSDTGHPLPAKKGN